MRAIAIKLLDIVPASIKRFLMLSMLESDDALLDRMTFKVADTCEELEQTFRLLHEAYVWRGLIEPRQNGLYIPLHAVLPATSIFIGKMDGKVVCTVSVIEENPLGLPMENVYHDEVAAWRQSGRHFAEVSALAVGRGLRRKGLAFLLYKIGYIWSWYYRGVQDLLIANHPDADIIYRGVVLFEPFGAIKMYSSLKNAPASASRLDLQAWAQTLRNTYGKQRSSQQRYPLRFPYQFFVERQFPNVQLPEPIGIRPVPRLSSQELTYLIEQDPLWLEGITPEQAQQIVSTWPEFSSVLASKLEAQGSVAYSPKTAPPDAFETVAGHMEPGV